MDVGWTSSVVAVPGGVRTAITAGGRVGERIVWGRSAAAPREREASVGAPRLGRNFGRWPAVPRVDLPRPGEQSTLRQELVKRREKRMIALRLGIGELIGANRR